MGHSADRKIRVAMSLAHSVIWHIASDLREMALNLHEFLLRVQEMYMAGKLTIHEMDTVARTNCWEPLQLVWDIICNIC